MIRAAVVGLGWWGKQIISYLKTSQYIQVTHGVDLQIEQLHEFTQEHPFISMPMTSAMKILDTEKGFRLATPSEVKEFYS